MNGNTDTCTVAVSLFFICGNSAFHLLTNLRHSSYKLIHSSLRSLYLVLMKV